MKNSNKRYFRLYATPDIEVDENVAIEEVEEEIQKLFFLHKGLCTFFKVGFVELEEIDDDR